MNDYRSNRQWSDQFLPQIISLFTPRKIVVASDEQDMHEATDLVFVDDGTRMAVRMRRAENAKRFPDQPTIRSLIPSGTETELSKILRGYGDLLFYGHDNGRGGLGLWRLIDLRVFRKAWCLSPRPFVWGERTNNDGTQFIFFNVTTFPVSLPILIARSDHT